MDPHSGLLRPQHSRREMLKSSALALLPLVIPSATNALHEQQPMTANGGTDPYPIPWLDKNGSHNQPAGANLEPSHIYHFKGRVARSSTFTGIGTDYEPPMACELSIDTSARSISDAADEIERMLANTGILFDELVDLAANI